MKLILNLNEARIIEEMEVNLKTNLTIRLAAGGGFAISLIQQ